MAFKSIYFSKKKERRIPYRKSKVFDKTCRNHGACGYCRSNRLHNTRKREQQLLDQLKSINND